jgi:hypothetical protein
MHEGPIKEDLRPKVNLGAKISDFKIKRPHNDQKQHPSSYYP